MRVSALNFVNDIIVSGSEETVSTIGETEESESVLKVLNQARREIEEEIDWKHRHILVRLDTPSGNATTWDNTVYPDLPWVMGIPTNVESVYHIHYKGKLIGPVSKDWFTNQIINERGLKTDRDPQHWTSLDDRNIIFDAFDTDDGDRLLASNSEAAVVKFTGTDMSADDDTIDMPDRFYTALLYLAQSKYLEDLEKDYPAADRKTRRYVTARSKLMRWARRDKSFVPYFRDSPNFARNLPTRRLPSDSVTEVLI